MRKFLAAALFLSACSHAQAGDFVTRVPPATLPGPKYDFVSIPVGADPNRYIRAADYNAHTNALYDVQTWIMQVVHDFHGIQGPTGATGATGATGSTGAQGPAGSINAIGSNLDFTNTYTGVNVPTPTAPAQISTKAYTDQVGAVLGFNFYGLGTCSLTTQKGIVTVTLCSHPVAGHYQITVPGITASAIVVCSSTIVGVVRVTSNTGGMEVYTYDSTFTLADASQTNCVVYRL